MTTASVDIDIDVNIEGSTIVIAGEPAEHGKPEDTPGGRPEVPPGQEENPGNRLIFENGYVAEEAL